MDSSNTSELFLLLFKVVKQQTFSHSVNETSTRRSLSAGEAPLPRDTRTPHTLKLGVLYVTP